VIVAISRAAVASSALPHSFWRWRAAGDQHMGQLPHISARQGPGRKPRPIPAHPGPSAAHGRQVPDLSGPGTRVL